MLVIHKKGVKTSSGWKCPEFNCWHLSHFSGFCSLQYLTLLNVPSFLHFFFSQQLPTPLNFTSLLWLVHLQVYSKKIIQRMWPLGGTLKGRHFFSRLVDLENRQVVKKQMGKWKVEPRSPFAEKLRINMRFPLFILLYHVYFSIFQIHCESVFLLAFPSFLYSAFLCFIVLCWFPTILQDLKFLLNITHI